MVDIYIITNGNWKNALVASARMKGFFFVCVNEVFSKSMYINHNMDVRSLNKIFVSFRNFT